MFLLGSEYVFPPIELADPHGIIAIGGDLNPNRLIEAYKNGIFPWYNEGEPIVWYSPDPRMVLKPSNVYISKSMRKILNEGKYKVTFNQNFEQVIERCQKIKRDGQRGTWITRELKKSMIELHKMGYAKSVEVWLEEKLVGGLYGMDLDYLFCGESMFSLMPNTSKIAFIALCKKLDEDNYPLLDCQVYTEHLESLGAYEISRKEFKTYLNLK